MVNYNNLLANIRRLIEILKQETKFLQEMKIKEFASSYEEKLAIFELLNTQYKAIEQDPTSKATASLPLQNNLKQAAEALTKARAENLQWLTAAMKVNQTILKLINQAMIQYVYSQQYNKHGETRANIQNIEASSIALTLNKTI